MHMRNACHVTGTPNMKHSLEKGDALQLLQPPRPPPEPIAPVPELELLNFVRDYFSGGPATHDYRCQVLTRVRTRFVDCPFAEFGYGTFREFCIKHGLDPPPIKEKKTARTRKARPRGRGTCQPGRFLIVFCCVFYTIGLTAAVVFASTVLRIRVVLFSSKEIKKNKCSKHSFQ